MASIDTTLHSILEPFSNWFFGIVFTPLTISGYSVPIVVIWMIIAALFFTLYFGFINLRGIGHAVNLVRGKHDDPDAPGYISHFQALTTALSGTVGLGNIAGVAAAISLGGPGAVIWMILAGFLGMSTKFIECTLGVKYRHIRDDGHISGGPMYYLRRGLRDMGAPAMGKALAAIYAVCCIGGSLGAGNMFQANQAFQQFTELTAGSWGLINNGWIFGVIVAVMVASVILGGIKSIAQVTSRIVPVMGVLYITIGFVVLGLHAGQIGPSFEIIWDSAFNMSAAQGGLLGALIVGFQRAAFSNEAGIGSASIAHAPVKTHHPVTEGYVAMIGPFFDTIIVCTMTALVIVMSGVDTHNDAVQGITLTSAAFATAFDWFPYLLGLAAILFAFSTMLAWAYYGAKAVNFLFYENPRAEKIYKVLFCVVTVFGTASNLESVLELSDALIFAMTIPNIIGLYLLAPTVKRDLNTYINHRVK